MCGRFSTAGIGWAKIHEMMSIIDSSPPDGLDNLRQFNIPPTSTVPIVTGPVPAVQLARWGFVPGWWSKPLAQMKLATFNARSEEAEGKPFFRDAMKRGHCLVPMSGYFEWQVDGKARTPYLIGVETNAPGFCAAGLWSQVRLPDFDGLTFTILTRGASDPLTPIHDRQPVLLDASSYAAWLRGEGLADVTQADPGRLRWHRVAPAVGSVKNERPDLLDPVD